jgi:hypothetical protein
MFVSGDTSLRLTEHELKLYDAINGGSLAVVTGGADAPLRHLAPHRADDEDDDDDDDDDDVVKLGPNGDPIDEPEDRARARKRAATKKAKMKKAAEKGEELHALRQTLERHVESLEARLAHDNVAHFGDELTGISFQRHPSTATARAITLGQEIE